MGQQFFIAVLLGGGVGSRLKSNVPKAFVKIRGETLLEKVAATFSSMKGVFSKIVATAPTGYESEAKSLTQRYGIDVITGGKERQDSSRLALEYVISNYPDVDLTDIYILIHDIARCYVTEELIKDTIEGVKTHSAVTLAIPSTDSLKRADSSGKVIESLDRSKIWMIQTPQAFRADLLVRAHKEADNLATDDAALVEKIAPVYIVEGSAFNKKITNPEDLRVDD